MLAPRAPGLAAAAGAPAPGMMTAPGMEGPAPVDDSMGVAATPEEQALYDKVVATATQALYDESVMQDLVKAAKASGDPAGEVANVAAAVAMRVYSAASEAGTQIPGDVMLHAGKEIVEVAVEIVETAGIPMEDEQVEEAYYRALDSFRSMAQSQGLYGDDAMAEDMAALQGMEADPAFQQAMAKAGGAAPMPTQGPV